MRPAGITLTAVALTLVALTACSNAPADPIQACADAIKVGKAAPTTWPTECDGLTDAQKGDAMRRFADQAATTPAATTTPSPSTPAGSAVPIGTPVKVGDPSAGAEITVLKVGPVTPAAGETWKVPGVKLVGIQVRVTNIGTSVFADPGPLNAQIIGADGAHVERVAGPASIREGRILPGYELRPGQSITSWQAYGIPVGTTPAYVRVRVGEQAIEWAVR